MYIYTHCNTENIEQSNIFFPHLTWYQSRFSAYFSKFFSPFILIMSNTDNQNADSQTSGQTTSPLTPPSTTDISSPYFLHSTDHPGSILVSTLLNGDNYPTWKRAMKMALNAKNKLAFVNGTLSKPTSSAAETQIWERCSDMVLSWILNSID